MKKRLLGLLFASTVVFTSIGCKNTENQNNTIEEKQENIENRQDDTENIKTKNTKKETNKKKEDTDSLYTPTEKENSESTPFIEGTDARKVIDGLVSQYQMYENCNGIEPDITHNLLYNGYSKQNENTAFDYDITANGNGEIEFATFTTYFGNLDYLIFCASLINGNNVNTEEITKWVTSSTTNSEIEIGDAYFSLIYNLENIDGSIKLYVDGDL